MKKLSFIAVLFLAAALLCACAQEAPPVVPSTPAPTAVPTPSPTPTPPPTPSPEELQFQADLERLEEELKDLQTGDLFFFGTYEQDGNGENGAESVEWQVLDRQGDRLFVISRYVLDRVAYHEVLEDVTWETSSVRRWLNEDFFLSVFSEAEQTFIPEVTLQTEDNPFVLTDGGNDTVDRIALPSIAELHTHLSWELLRQTQYAFNGKAGWYWMRNTGFSLQNPSYISYDGTFNYGPYRVTEVAGIRPVMYLDVA